MPSALVLCSMCQADLVEVTELENSVQAFPWTLRHFSEALQAGYDGQVVRNGQGHLLGFILLMAAADEMHILVIAVSAFSQRQGIGSRLIHWAQSRARGYGATGLLLEVRPSNTNALAFYAKHDFLKIGLRRGYYAAPGLSREDAYVMKKISLSTMHSTPRVERAIGASSGQSLRLNTLQRAWLGELGMPRALLPATQSATHRNGVLADHAAVLTCGTVKPTASDATPPCSSRPVTDAPMGMPQRPVSKLKRAPYVRVPGVIEQASLADLRAMVAECEGCSLSLTRRHTVFGAGPTHANWMVVGEAPGEQEDLQGQPFVGKSGQLLTQMLHAVGVDRQTDVFIANVVKCRPPGNRNPKPEEIAQCRPFLMRQIEVVAPQRLLVLGRYAAQVLVGVDVTLNALRGQIHTFTGSNGRRIPMIVSYHPAYLLRSPQEKAKAWMDLRLAAQGIGPQTSAP